MQTENVQTEALDVPDTARESVASDREPDQIDANEIRLKFSDKISSADDVASAQIEEEFKEGGGKDDKKIGGVESTV